MPLPELTAQQRDDALEKATAARRRRAEVKVGLKSRNISLGMNLVDDFVKTYYPTIDELVLAVNFKNTSAYQLYIKVGYTDDGSQREWNNGMQHLLRKKLK